MIETGSPIHECTCFVLLVSDNRTMNSEPAAHDASDMNVSIGMTMHR